ncbi:MAG: bifunctional hydroxymethylpyrimidine kinase/phosphomethylpyrimidine kinase [Lachnospiraceae bacterium]|nr:bifunctional hydroxymethylpyrimidine kinase/phosphomethylpyrimidine kinase [Lachnospiraceae bacterium]
MNKKILLINELKRNNRDGYLNSVSIVSAFGDRAYTCIDENIKYDAVITGYIKNSDYILNVREYIADLKLDNNRVLTLIDPCFADSGIKYDGITDNHISNFKKLLELSDIMTPNLTEACMLVNEPYEKYREKYCTIVYESGNKDKTNELSKKIIESIFPLLEKLRIKKNQITIITGIELYNSVLTILDVYDGDHGKRQTTCNYSEKIEDRSGAGEIFNTMFFETSTNGFNLVDSLSASTSFVNNSLRFSRDNNFDKKYGIVFEPILYDNVTTIKQRLIDIKNNIKNKE